LQDSSTSTVKHEFLPAGKRKVVPVNAMKAYGREKVYMHIFLTSVPDSRGE
jgi:hypothetical protein